VWWFLEDLEGKRFQSYRRRGEIEGLEHCNRPSSPVDRRVSCCTGAVPWLKLDVKSCGLTYTALNGRARVAGRVAESFGVCEVEGECSEGDKGGSY